MRRELVIFAVVLAVVLMVGLAGRFLITGMAVNELKNAFPGYDVSIGGADIRSADMLAITDIRIKKASEFYGVDSIEIKFSPLSLFTKVVSKMTVKGCSLKFNSPGKKLRDIIGYPASKLGKGFVVKSIVISNTNVWFNTADWQLSAGFDGNIDAGKEITYKVNINLGDLDLASLPKCLNVAGKVRLIGQLRGNLSLEGHNLELTYIKGDFVLSVDKNFGGELFIKDEELLKKLAENTKQPPAVFEDLRDYIFTKGTLQISGKSKALLFHMTLDGLKGKRDLTFPLSGF